MQGIDKNSDKICTAAKEGNVNTVLKCLTAEAACWGARDFSGWQPLHIASARGWEGVVQVLLDFGADTEAR